MAEATLTRPDGSPYRPRTHGLRTRAWENPDDLGGCIVFGTLDPAAAWDQAYRACSGWFGDADVFELANPIPGWWRDGFGLHGRAWIEDAKRGAPGVMFTWAERDSGSSPSDTAS